MSSKGNKSLQRELDSFYKEVMGSEFTIREVTKGAFTQSRSHLNPSAFIELNENALNTFYEQAPYLLWKGMRLLAVDGTSLVLPKHPTVAEEFGVEFYGPHADSPQSLARVSLLYDVLNMVTLDAQIAPFMDSERKLLNHHFPKLEKGDLLLLDRGYPSISLFYKLHAQGVQYCVRMKESWLEVKDFCKSGETERIVQFTLPKKDEHILEEYPELKGQTLRCRLVAVTLENGEKEILCTSLLDAEKYPQEHFLDLYHYRWNEEEAYKLLKSRAEIECFSGKTALAVKQDFFARIFAMTYCSILAFPIEERLRQEYQSNNNKHPQKVNRTSALAMVRNICLAMFLQTKIPKALAAFDAVVYKSTEIIRPGRRFKRKKKQKVPKSMNYKEL